MPPIQQCQITNIAGKDSATNSKIKKGRVVLATDIVVYIVQNQY